MSIIEALEGLQQAGVYPFHMPGHKRRMKDHPLSQAYERDITEIDGFDNLHDPQGIILEAMEKAKKLYGTKESFFLVNGSTAGILSAVHACVSYGEKIIISRNSHKSVYNAIALLNLQTAYLYPKQIPEWNMAAGITGEEVRRVIQKNPDAKAVLITSPTYEGFVSPIRDISRLAHEAGIPLIVDEAHGAHFPFSEEFPESALYQGADLVIQSLHKTMPSLTQTAILHVQGNLIRIRKLKRFLSTFQSSSPSYLLMASIEECLLLAEKKGTCLWKIILKKTDEFYRDTEKLKYIRIWKEKTPARDPLKLILAPGRVIKDGKVYTGADLYRELLEDHHLQLEMAASAYALGILSCMDDPSGLERLKKALFKIDGELTAIEDEEAAEACLKAGERQPGLGQAQRPFFLQVKESIGNALDRKEEWVDLCRAEGREAAGFINLYPPGIPLIVPGEVISSQFVATLILYRKQDLPIQGLEEGKIAVVKEDL
ncbi:MAG: aminotransferase class I/II-fold pyridoxal phosphate-dependent enzyme [Lachnospiraceae bacterium]|nr:aminotransferase class I/II-fold pyridoxal phosphate-dependent enzyme [Lachnospiraceae bacterium]